MDDQAVPAEVTSEAEGLASPPAAPEARPPVPKFSGSHETGHAVAASPSALQKVFRVDEPEQAKAYLQHCLAVLHPKEAGAHADSINDQRPFMVSVVNDIGARDAVERMLAVQMAATHVALIRAGGWLAKADTLPRLEAYSTAYNKLARTYATQMEALRKHRNGGQQKVQVEHVHVHPGGQAIVGDVHHGGRGVDDAK
jgi:hypothetical protein